jgi:hypothetical protein
MANGLVYPNRDESYARENYLLGSGRFNFDADTVLAHLSLAFNPVCGHWIVHDRSQETWYDTQLSSFNETVAHIVMFRLVNEAMGPGGVRFN